MVYLTYIELAVMVGWMSIFSFILSYPSSVYKQQLRSLGVALTSISLLATLPYMYGVNSRIAQSTGIILASILGFSVSKRILDGSLKIPSSIKLITASGTVMLLVYTVEPFQDLLVEMSARDTVFFLDLLGFDPGLLKSNENVYIIFPETSNELKIEIVTACTGVGTISIVIGLVATIKDFSIIQKVWITLLSISVIYLLNIIRTVFISLAYGHQLLHISPGLIEVLFAEDGTRVSYYIADRLLSQSITLLILCSAGYYVLTRYKTNIVHEWIEIMRSAKLVFS